MIDRSTAIGLGYALGAFGMWGVFPIYFKALESVPALEVLAHRVVWTVVFTAILIGVLGRWRSVVSALSDRRLVMTLIASAAIISVNWGVFIWSIDVGRLLDASLGYYINPLVSVVLGVVFLGERMRRVQWVALALAAAGVAYAVLAAGTFPWVALTLAFTFGAYGLIRKVAAVSPLTGLFVETTLIAPVALGYVGWLTETGVGHFGVSGGVTTALLVAAGVVTATPLLLFVAGAKRIKLSTVGLLQYLVPSMHFGLAILAFGEPLTADKLVVFAFIWCALAIYSSDAIRHSQRSGAAVGVVRRNSP